MLSASADCNLQNERAEVVLSEQKKVDCSSSKPLKMTCAKRTPEHKRTRGKFNLKRFKFHKHKRFPLVGSCEVQKESSDTKAIQLHAFNGFKTSSTSTEQTGDTQIQIESGTLPAEGNEQFEARISELTEQVRELENYLEITKDQKENLHSQLQDKDKQLKLIMAELTLQTKELQNHYSISKTENEQLKSQLKDRNKQLNAKDIHLAEMTVEVKELEKSLCRATQKRLQSPDVLHNKSRNGLCKAENQSAPITKEMALVLAEREQEIVSLQQQLEDIKETSEMTLTKLLDPLDSIEVLRDVVDLNEEMGRGAYGVVKKVSLHGTICAAKDIHAILVNYADKKQFEAIKKNFLEECNKCSRVFHPNIVQFLGIHYPSEDVKLPWLVMEKMDCSLTSFLAKHMCMSRSVSSDVKISIIHDISLGLRYLHARDIIHRDLSSNNILLTKHLTAKIADLGVAKLIDPDGTRSHTLAPGTQHFLPPETVSTNPQYGKPVDVFSLGCVMIHLMTHEWPVPAAETHYDEILGRKAVLSEVERRQAYLDQILEPAALKDLILLCLHDNPRERPMISNVCAVIDEVREHCPKQCPVTAGNRLEFEEHLRAQEVRANEQLMEIILKEIEINRLNIVLQETNKQLENMQKWIPT